MKTSNLKAQQLILDSIHRDLARLRSKNRSYSLRAYSRRLGVSPSALSEAMSGKHPVTLRMAEKIIAKLSLEPGRIEEILNHLRNRNPAGKPSRLRPKPRVNSHPFNLLDMDRYQLISEWHYFAILSLAETEGFQSDARWIAGRLGLSPKLVQDSVARLLRLGLLLKDEAGALAPTGLQYKTTSEFQNHAIRRCHFQHLELAQRSLERDDVADADITAITLAIDPARIPEAKKLIRGFRRRLCRLLEEGPKKEVFKFCIQLFPVSKTIFPEGALNGSSESELQ